MNEQPDQNQGSFVPGQVGIEDEFDQFSNYDTTGVTEESLTRGGAVSSPGKFHFMVSGVGCTSPKAEDENPSTPCARIDLEVLPAAYPTEGEQNQVGRICYLRCYAAKKRMRKVLLANGDTAFGNDGKPQTEFDSWVAVSDGQRDINMRVAMALGIISAEQLGQSNTSITKRMWESCVGRQCHGEVVAEDDKYKGKDANGEYAKRYVISYGKINSVTDPEVLDWPKDPEAMSLGNLQAGGAARAAGQQPTPSDMDDLNNLAG